MKLKHLIAFLFIMSCQLPPPTPQPNPTEPPAPVKVIARDDFNGASTLFIRGGNAGNVSSIADGKYNLIGDANGAAWIYTQAYGLDSLIEIRTSISASADFYIGLSTTLDSSSSRAIFDAERRLLFYAYRKSDGSYGFHEKFRDAGTPKEFDPATSIVPSQKCYLSFAFDTTANTISMLYSVDGNAYSEIGEETVSAPWDSVYFAISAWRTPMHGIASVNWAEIEYWSKQDTIKPPPPLPKFRKAILKWNPNKESDLLGYNVFMLVSNSITNFFTQDTVAYLDSLNMAQHKFFITAIDSARNESAPSDTVDF